MHQRYDAPCYIGRQFDPIHGFGGEKGRGRDHIRTGRQANREPFKMARIGIRSGQRESMGAERLFG
jgi:hypothetical protein